MGWNLKLSEIETIAQWGKFLKNKYQKPVLVFFIEKKSLKISSRLSYRKMACWKVHVLEIFAHWVYFGVLEKIVKPMWNCYSIRLAEKRKPINRFAKSPILQLFGNLYFRCWCCMDYKIDKILRNSTPNILEYHLYQSFISKSPWDFTM